ncbi:MAG: hypothetical protein EPO24_07670 [Bacteroidetes bacterium]|nr:MAG: hypothetical protein EPO24_07670 [Bacteroidota bacterium]
MNRKLHAAATELVGKGRAHEMLHLTITEEPFYCESLSDLKPDQALALLRGIEAQVKARKQQMNNALEQPGFITQRQLSYMRDLVTQLGWSDEYFLQMLGSRYGFVDDVNKMPERKAIAVIAYLKYRATHKKIGAFQT